MAKKFLGTVGDVTALKRTADGKWDVAFYCKTLTDSGLSIATTKDDIRGGEGGNIQFSFYHDPSVEVTLTDIQWKKEYLEAQMGTEFSDTGADYYKDEMLTVAEAGKLTLSEQPKALPLLRCSGTNTTNYVWAKKASDGEEGWHLYEFEDNSKEITIEGAQVGEKYCVRYLTYGSNASDAKIYASFVPTELFLVIKCPIFAGDACAASKGNKAGEMQYEIPRFLLNGSFDFAMNMSTNQNVSLSGNVAASEGTECDENGGILLRVIQRLFNENWYDGVTELIVDEDSLKVNATPAVYGVKNNKLISIDNQYLTFTPALTDGKFASAGSVTIALTDKPSITDTVTVEA